MCAACARSPTPPTPYLPFHLHPVSTTPTDSPFPFLCIYLPPALHIQLRGSPPFWPVLPCTSRSICTLALSTTRGTGSGYGFARRINGTSSYPRKTWFLLPRTQREGSRTPLLDAQNLLPPRSHVRLHAHLRCRFNVDSFSCERGLATGGRAYLPLQPSGRTYHAFLRCRDTSLPQHDTVRVR